MIKVFALRKLVIAGCIVVSASLVACSSDSSSNQSLNQLSNVGATGSSQMSTVRASLPLSDGIENMWSPQYSVALGEQVEVDMRFEQTTSSPWNPRGVESRSRSLNLEADFQSRSSSLLGSKRPGVFTARPALLKKIVSDARSNKEPYWCQTVELSNRDPRWGIMDESNKARKNPDQCTLSDAFSFVGLVKGKWRLLEYPGSYVDNCSSFRNGLEKEGVSSRAISDFLTTFDCEPGNENSGVTSDQVEVTGLTEPQKKFVKAVRPIFNSDLFAGLNIVPENMIKGGYTLCEVFSVRGKSIETIDFLARALTSDRSRMPLSQDEAMTLIWASTQFLCPQDLPGAPTVSPLPNPASPSTGNSGNSGSGNSGSGTQQGQSQVTVPNIVGLPAGDAQTLLKSMGLRMSPGAPFGSSAYIKTQNPKAGAQIRSGSSVFVFFSL
jgi:hypothetical protein